jgi:DNA-binding HxlR family transcriptional regulator
MPVELPDASAYNCRVINSILARVGHKWTMLVMLALSGKPQRFNDIIRAITGISARVLSLVLRDLERDGLVDRQVTPSTPPRVDYALTPRGAEMLEIVQQMTGWAKANIHDIAACRAAFDQVRNMDTDGPTSS